VINGLVFHPYILQRYNMAHPIPGNTCPYCGHNYTHAGGPKNPPVEGDFSVCIRCSEPAVFDEHLKLRKPSDAELIAMSMSNELEDVVKRVRALPP
jgi:hypothetical protein